MVTEARDPCNAQLSGRNPFTLSDFRETIKDFVLESPLEIRVTECESKCEFLTS